MIYRTMHYYIGTSLQRFCLSRGQNHPIRPESTKLTTPHVKY